jgi:hypothetical protein
MQLLHRRSTEFVDTARKPWNSDVQVLWHTTVTEDTCFCLQTVRAHVTRTEPSPCWSTKNHCRLRAAVLSVILTSISLQQRHHVSVSPAVDPASWYRFTKRSSVDPSARAVYGVGLRLLSCGNCEFETRRGHRCLFLVSVVWVM